MRRWHDLHLHVRRRAAPDAFFFFFNDTATTEIYTLSLHDALPISLRWVLRHQFLILLLTLGTIVLNGYLDRKSTRLNSSHSQISYAVFCLKKKNQPTPTPRASPYRNVRAH